MNNTRLFVNKSYSNLNKPIALTTDLCNQTFKNNLRGNDNKIHNEHRMIEVRKRTNKRPQESHVFTGESFDPPRSHVAKIYVPSQVMFNDAYFEKNPKINKVKTVRHQIELMWKNNPQRYLDEHVLPKGRQNCMEKKLKDIYSVDPIAKYTIDDECKREKSSHQIIRTDTLARCNSSLLVKKSFRNIRQNSIPKQASLPSKIVNDDYQDCTKINMNEGHKSNHGTRHHRNASVGRTLQHAFTYF